MVWYSIVQYSTVQYSIVQYSTVQYSIVQYSIVQYSIVQYKISHYLKRCAQSARPWKKAVKEVKEVKTNKTKRSKKTLVQLWHKIVPKWIQNGYKLVPRWSQDAPRRPQETTKNNKNTKTKHTGPQKAKTPKSPHLLGPKLDPKLTHFGLILVTVCQHVYEEVSSFIFDGFWEASEPSFFDSR